jgi:hypothetical protein
MVVRDILRAANAGIRTYKGAYLGRPAVSSAAHAFGTSPELISA